MLFHPKNKPLDHHIKLFFNDFNIEQVHSCRFLGVFFRSDLGWSDHINYIRLKMARSIYVIYRVRHLLPLQVKKQLYFALVQSHLVYCNLVWGTCNKTDSHKLLSLQKRALRLLSSSSSVEANLFETFHVRNFFHLYNFSLALHIFYKIKHDFNSFSNTYNSRNVAYGLRSVALSTARPRTNYGKQTTDYQIITLCNAYQSLTQIALEVIVCLYLRKN